MRFSEIIQETRQTIFYHGSKKEFPAGFILKPQPDGYVHGMYGDEADVQIRKTEKILERYRPKHMISRFESVFLVATKAAIEHAGGNATHVYKVEPIGVCERACLWWYSEIENNIVSGNSIPPDTIKTWALNYWNAVPPPDSKPATYEYRCREAKITQILR